MKNIIDDFPKNKLRFDFGKTILIELVAVFFVVLCGTLISAYTQVINMGMGTFNLYLLVSILENSILYAITFVLGYSVLGSIYHKTHTIIEQFFTFLKGIKLNKKQILSFNIYIITASVVAFASVRPLIQRAFFDKDISDITDLSIKFVKYDFNTTLLLIGIFCFVTIFALFATNTQSERKSLIMVSIILIVYGGGISLNNARADYKAAIFEARGLYHSLSDINANTTYDRKKYNDNISDIGKQVFGKASEAMELAKSDKDRAYALYWMASGYMYMNEGEKALESLLKSIEYRPDRGYVYGTLSYLYTSELKYKLAIEMANKCLKFDGPESYCYAPLAKAQWFMGDYEESTKTIERALELNPGARTLQRALEFHRRQVPKKLAETNEFERMARKDNEPLNACLAIAGTKTYHSLFSQYCIMENQDPGCTFLNNPEHGEELSSRMFSEKSKCYEQYATIQPQAE